MKNKELSKQKLILDNLLIEEKEDTNSINIWSGSMIAILSIIVSCITTNIFYLLNVTNDFILLNFKNKFPEGDIDQNILKQLIDIQFEANTEMMKLLSYEVLPIIIVAFLIITVCFSNINRKRIRKLKNINLRLNIINEIIASTKSR